MPKLQATPPFKNIVDIVFKNKLLPAAYRWISALPPEELIRFEKTFARLARDDVEERPSVKTAKKDPLMASRYTIPEWKFFRPEPEKEKTDEDLLSCPTQTHLTYGNYTAEQARAARAYPTRTRANDKSQINAVAETPEYMARWTARNMKTSYTPDNVPAQLTSSMKSDDELNIQIAGKGVLSEVAVKRAKKYESDEIWFRDLRELCRSLMLSSEATSYREGFTETKKVNEERIGIPKWIDPEPMVSRGVHHPAESFWQTTSKRIYVAPEKTNETFHAISQHKACYSRPFDLYPMTEKMQTTFREDFVDHMGNKDDHPEYFRDMRVRIPPGSGVVGDVLGNDVQH